MLKHGESASYPVGSSTIAPTSLPNPKRNTNMETNDKPLNGIIIDGKVYKAMPGQLKDIFQIGVDGVLHYTKSTITIDARTGKHREYVHNYRFRFSQPLTDKINGGGNNKLIDNENK